VRFADGLSRLVALGDVLLLEVGPGRTLVQFARDATIDSAPRGIYASLGRAEDEAPDQRVVLESLGGLWLAGARIDWRGFYAHERRRRIRLPTYPFQRKRYWIDPPSALTQASAALSEHIGEAQTSARASVTPTLYPRPALRTPYEAATSPLEMSLVQIWEQLLGTTPIGANDSFFELGGNSLLATRLATRLRETFPLDVPLRALFEAATIREQARLVESLLSEKIDSLSEEEAARLLAGIAEGDLGR
jgi:hypothetical protein